MIDSEAMTPIFTIGYGTRSIDQFLAVLNAHRIKFLIDVRSTPYSRYKPEFSQGRLSSILTQRGIRYVFMGDTLGGHPRDEDCYIEGRVDYRIVMKKDHYQLGIKRLQNAFVQQQRVVIMCSEGRPEHCHRSKLIGVTLASTQIPTIHIDEMDKDRTQDEVIERLTSGQLKLFGTETFRSRGIYRR